MPFLHFTRLLFNTPPAFKCPPRISLQPRCRSTLLLLRHSLTWKTAAGIIEAKKNKNKQILRRVSSAIPFLAPGLTCQKRWRLNDKVTKHINPGVKHQLTLTHRCNYTWVTMPHCSVMKKKKFLKGPRTDCIFRSSSSSVNDVLGLTFYRQISGLCCFSTENQFKNTIGRKINYLVAL